jgi:hypothetical protein
MDRAWFAAVTAFPASLHGFTDLILHNCLLQLPQQGLCVVKEQAQVLSAKIVGRTAKANDIAPPSFSIVKRRFDKNTYIHGGSRLVLKLLPYHADQQVLPTPRMRLSLRGAKNDGKPRNMHSGASVFGRFCDRLSRHAHLQPTP